MHSWTQTTTSCIASMTNQRYTTLQSTNWKMFQFCRKTLIRNRRSVWTKTKKTNTLKIFHRWGCNVLKIQVRILSHYLSQIRMITFKYKITFCSSRKTIIVECKLFKKSAIKIMTKKTMITIYSSIKNLSNKKFMMNTT